MPPFRFQSTVWLSRTYTTTTLRRANPPFAVVPTCPSPTCACAPTPPLDIDHNRPLANTIAPYAQHILICTGQRDWTSRIEDESSSSAWGRLTAYLKHELGPKGSAHDSHNPTLITTSSFSPNANPPAEALPRDDELGSMLLFPSFQHYHNLDLSAPALPAILAATHGQQSALPSTSITTPTILICSHNTRDSRCGILGPILQQEFANQLANMGMSANTSTFLSEEAGSVNVGCTSHIGGHKWAGNVIVYLPENTPNELAGAGVWYGRVEPRHIEGIIKETVLEGRIIEDLWRGGIRKDGKRMWI